MNLHDVADVCVILSVFGTLIFWVFNAGGAFRELRSNGGKSVKDRVGKLETSQIDQTNRLIRIENKINVLPQETTKT